MFVADRNSFICLLQAYFLGYTITQQVLFLNEVFVSWYKMYRY